MNAQLSPPCALGDATADPVVRVTHNMLLPAARASPNEPSLRLRLDNDRKRATGYFDDVLSALRVHLVGVLNALHGGQTSVALHRWQWTPVTERENVAPVTAAPTNVLDEFFYASVAVGVTYIRRALAGTSQLDDACKSAEVAECVFGGVVLHMRSVQQLRQAAVADALRYHAYSLRCQLHYNKLLEGRAAAVDRAVVAALAAHAARAARHQWTRAFRNARESCTLFNTCITNMTHRALTAVAQLSELPSATCTTFKNLANAESMGSSMCVALLIDANATAPSVHELMYDADDDDDAAAAGGGDDDDDDDALEPTDTDENDTRLLTGRQLVYVHLADANLATSRPEFSPSALVCVGQNKRRRRWVVSDAVCENKRNVAVVLPLRRAGRRQTIAPVEANPCLRRWITDQ